MSEELGNINLPGAHFHFLNEDLSYGGHVLDLAFSSVSVQVDAIRTFTVLVSEIVLT